MITCRRRSNAWAQKAPWPEGLPPWRQADLTESVSAAAEHTIGRASSLPVNQLQFKLWTRSFVSGGVGQATNQGVLASFKSPYASTVQTVPCAPACCPSSTAHTQRHTDTHDTQADTQTHRQTHRHPDTHTHTHTHTLLLAHSGGQETRTKTNQLLQGRATSY